MSEITATEKGQRKKRQPEKWATENWATGKLGNKKWAGRKKGQHEVIVRKEMQRYFRLQKKWQPQTSFYPRSIASQVITTTIAGQVLNYFRSMIYRQVD